MANSKGRLKRIVLAIVSLFLILPVFFMISFLIYGFIDVKYARRVVVVKMKNSLEELDQVSRAEVELPEMWLVGLNVFNVKLELLSGDVIAFENVRKNLEFHPTLGQVTEISGLKFICARKSGGSGPYLPLDLLQIYMHDNLSTVPLFLDKYPEIKEAVMNLPSATYFHGGEGYIFDEIDYMGQDLKGRYFELYKQVHVHLH